MKNIVYYNVKYSYLNDFQILSNISVKLLSRMEDWTQILYYGEIYKLKLKNVTVIKIFFFYLFIPTVLQVKE